MLRDLIIDALFVLAKVPDLLVGAAFAILDGVDGTATKDRRRDGWESHN